MSATSERVEHEVTVQPAGRPLARAEQLAGKLAAWATAAAPPPEDVLEAVIDRVIDDAAVAVASLTRHPVRSARDQALAHRRAAGATVVGLGPEIRVEAEWAAWANGVAVRELDFHDTFLAAEYAHPGDNIPPLVAVAQQCGRPGSALAAAIAVAYEVQIDLARGISLHAHKIDHVAHLGPAVAAGCGALLGLDAETTFAAIGQALHVTTATRQSRKGQISSWKAYAPAFAGKAAIEAVDRAMRGEGAPEPIYEGEDAVIAQLLDGPGARYVVALPEPGAPARAILESFTKEHSAEYQAQAFIDLARRLRHALPGGPAGLADVASIVIATSHHTHNVIGTGAGDPEKFDPDASRETLDHSLMYIFAVALEDGAWHHVDSYLPERAHRPSTLALWRSISTVEDPEWTRRYLAADPDRRAYGGRVVVTMRDGTTIADEIVVADAHPRGARPFGRAQYVEKFHTLAAGVVAPAEQERFLAAAQRLSALGPDELGELTIKALDAEALARPSSAGIF